ncbi:MAG: hypothetical protein ABI697_12700 [Devosia sp.]
MLWAKLLLRLGLVLLLLGLGPLLLLGTLLPDLDPFVPVFLSFTIGPLGAVVLLLGIIPFLVALLRRRRGSSAPAPDP